MKDEYDFSTAKRGKFFRESARLAPPIYLDPEVFDHLSKRALAQGVSLGSLVNALLKMTSNHSTRASSSADLDQAFGTAADVAEGTGGA